MVVIQELVLRKKSVTSSVFSREIFHLNNLKNKNGQTSGLNTTTTYGYMQAFYIEGTGHFLGNDQLATCIIT